jgi:hypothetical protein
MIYPDRAKEEGANGWFGFAKRLSLAIAAAALCALLYLRLAPSQPVLPTPPVTEAGIRLQPSILRLSALVDKHIDQIFSPLEAKIPPLPQQELRMLREAFADGARAGLPEERPVYTTAFQLCDRLLSAIQEREQAALTLADSRAKPFSVALARDSTQEAEEKKRFFESNIHKRWADASTRHRNHVAQLYSRLREQERQFNSR